MAADTRISNVYSSSGRGYVSGLAEIVLGTLRTWVERAEARRDLAELSPREVADIGLDPDELAREVAKPFWRA